MSLPVRSFSTSWLNSDMSNAMTFSHAPATRHIDMASFAENPITAGLETPGHSDTIMLSKSKVTYTWADASFRTELNWSPTDWSLDRSSCNDVHWSTPVLACWLD